VMFSALCLLIICAALRSPEAKNAEIFKEMQALLRTRREVLGESTYEYYNNGEYAVEYKMDGLVTYRSEALCARSLEGCGENMLFRRKREDMCMNMSEDLELCKRREINGLCEGVEKRMADNECEGLFQERKVRMKRDECLALNKRFEQKCKRAIGKRAIDEECSFVLNAMESSDCASEAEFLAKRGKKKGCDPGWSLYKGICFQYFKEPQSWMNAEKHCERLTNDKSSHLVTIERMLSSGKAGREFFHNLIESSGAIDHIDSVLSKMDDMFEGKNWKEVISYYDNWGWMGLQKNDEKFRWVDPKKKKEDWNVVKNGHGNWRKGQPSFKNDVGMDNGSCVVYFMYTKEKMDSALADPTDVGDIGAWFNANCGLQLPFVCEMDL